MKWGKRGIEVSVNFMVILIMALVVFGMGIIIVFKMLGAGDALVTDVTDDLRKNVQQMLSSLEGTVAIPYQTIEVKQGKAASIVVGVQNVVGGMNFDVGLYLGRPSVGVPGKSIEEAYIGSPTWDAPQACTSRCIRFGSPSPSDANIKEDIHISEQGFEVVLFPISTRSAKPGAYIFTVEVRCGETDDPGDQDSCELGELYDAPQKVLVIVK